MSTFHKQFLAALACFALAGATGAFLRFGIFHGMAGLNYANVRHAHSHLMFFSWVTPAIIALMAAQLPRLTGRPLGSGFRRIIPVLIGLGLLAYVPFLLYGYRSASIGSVNLPLAVIAATLSVLAWYVFAAVYFRQVWGAPRTRALWLMNAAVIFLLLATIGVIGMPIATRFGVENPVWSFAFTHIFLDLFSEGWFVLAVLGLAYAAMPDASQHPWARVSGDLLAAGLPLVFLLFLPVTMVPPSLRWVGSAAGLLVIIGTLGNVAALWRSTGRSAGGGIWRVPLVYLAAKALAQLGLLLPATAQWLEIARARVPYLHLLLLGFVTLGLFAAAQQRWGVAGRRWMVAAVTVLVLSLLPLSGLWPPGLGGLWALHAAAWAALGPVIVALAVLATDRRTAEPRVGEGIRN